MASRSGGSDSDLLRRYLEEVGAHPLLTAAEEGELASVIAAGRAGAIIVTGSKQGITTPPGNAPNQLFRLPVTTAQKSLLFEVRNLNGAGDLVVRRLLTDPAVPKVTWPDDLGWSRVVIEPRPKGVFRPLGDPAITGRMTLTVSFDYDGREASPEPALIGTTPPASGCDRIATPTSLKDSNKFAIQEALDQCHGNVSKAARLLGVSRGLLYRYLRNLGRDQ